MPAGGALRGRLATSGLMGLTLLALAALRATWATAQTGEAAPAMVSKLPPAPELSAPLSGWDIPPPPPKLTGTRREHASFDLQARTHASDGVYVASSDMGVQHCRLSMDSGTFGDDLASYPSFVLHVFVRYWAWEGTAYIRGFAAVQPLLPEGPVPSQPQPDVKIDPRLTLTLAGNDTSSWATAIPGVAHLPRTHPALINAYTSPLWAQFSVPAGSKHEYVLGSFASPDRCVLRPAAEPNVLDPRGVQADPRLPITHALGQPGSSPTVAAASGPRDASVLVYLPPANVTTNTTIRSVAVAALLDRHIEYHKQLGAKRTVVYAQPADVWPLSLQPQAQKWAANGQLLLVMWEGLPQPAGAPFFDQKAAYGHATLAFSCLDTILAMVDLDEYIVSPDPALKTLSEMFQKCGSGEPGPSNTPWRGAASLSPVIPRKVPVRPGKSYELAVNVRITRYHAIADNWDLGTSELYMWTNATNSTKHPILHYTRVNLQNPPAVKSIVRPEFVRTVHAHTAASLSGYNESVALPSCMMALHLRNMWAPKIGVPHMESTQPALSAHLASRRFVEEPALTASLKRMQTLLDKAVAEEARQALLLQEEVWARRNKSLEGVGPRGRLAGYLTPL